MRCKKGNSGRICITVWRYPRLHMPSLRERKEDIPMLTRHFIQKHAKRCKVKSKPVSREAMATLVNYEWPGNVRELENAIERALVMGTSEMILPEDLPESLLEQTAAGRNAFGKISCQCQGIEEAVDFGCGGADAWELLGRGRNSWSASELSAPADSELGIEETNSTRRCARAER